MFLDKCCGHGNNPRTRTPIGVRSMHRQTQTEDSPITRSFSRGPRMEETQVLMHVDILILYDLKRRFSAGRITQVCHASFLNRFSRTIKSLKASHPHWLKNLCPETNLSLAGDVKLVLEL